MSESKPAGGILQQMSKIQDRVGIMAHGIDYLIDNDAPSSITTRYMTRQQDRLAQAVAKITGGNAEDIAYKEKRTPEQERLLIELAGKEWLTRWAKFRNSDYTQVLEALFSRFEGTGDRPADLDTISDKDQMSIHNIALYFYATHPEHDPMESGQLTEADKAQILAYLDTALEIQRNKPGASLEQAIGEAIGIEFNAKTNLLSIVPKKHIMPNNKLTNALTTNSLADSIIDAGSYELEVIGKGTKAITAVCILTYEGDNVKLSGRQSFTEYDRNVYNAVTSLYVYGDKSHIVTPATVYRAMVNMTETETPSAQQIEAVTRSLDKMRFIRARVDCTAELIKRGARIDGEQITGGRIDTYLLAAEAVSVEAGGKTVRAYRIIKTPILYEYSSLVKQVLTIPAGLLDIKINGQRVRNTEQRIAIKGYLIRRIEGMKGKNALTNDTISFESYEKDGEHHAGIYERADAANASRAVKQRIRDYAEDVLRYWIDEGYISGYELIKGGGSARAVKSIRIILK
jgi:hypothetical protein